MPDPVALLKEASVTTKRLKSAHLALSVTGTIAEMPVKTLEGDLTNQPDPAAKGKAKISIMGSDTDIKFVVFGGRLYVLLPGAAWADYGPTANVFDVTAILDPDSGLTNLLTNFVDPKVDARETVGGQQAIRVTGKVTADAVNKVLPQLDAAKRMAASVWIQEGGDHQLVQLALEPGDDDAVQMVFSNPNAPVTVEKPPGT